MKICKATFEKINATAETKLVIISSNEKMEYEGCDEVIEMVNYKIQEK